jgi:drug/metabolite transporter (DMT)-like permease
MAPGVFYLQSIWGALCLSTASAIWGGMYVVSKYVLEYVPPMTLVNIRMAIAAVVLGILVWRSKEKRVASHHVAKTAMLGFIGFTVSIGSQFIGTKLSTASMGAIVTSASPSCIVLFAWLLNHEKIGVPQVAGLLLATMGVGVIAGFQGDQQTGHGLLGIGFLVIAAVTWALYTVLSKQMAEQYSTLVITYYAAVFGTIFTLPVSLWELHYYDVFLQDWHIAAGIMYLGIISTALAFYLWNKGFTMVSSGTGAVYFFLQPVFGAVLGWAFLGEQISVSTLLGAGIILLGVGCSTLFTPR